MFKSTSRIFFAMTLLLILTTVTYGFAAANTFTATSTYAGDGSLAISGYVISAIKYNLTAGTPNLIDTVTFTTNVAPPAGSTITIKLVSTGSTWYTCTGAGTTSITCANGGTLAAPVSTADQLRVIIAD
jgi:hypothetical protein